MSIISILAEFGPLILIALAVWRVGNILSDGMNEHIKAMESIDQRLAVIQKSIDNSGA